MERMYLVTGAAGYLGSNVCRQLLERGEKVRAFVLNGDKSVKYVPKEVEICFGDLCSKDDVDRFLTVPEGVESIVIHCASIISLNPEYNPTVMKVNAGGTQNVIDACLAHKECQKMVYISSTGAIPEQPKGTPITEVDRFEPADPSRVVGCYSQSKAKASQEVLDAVHEKGLNAVIVHPSGIMGPNDMAVSQTTSTLIKIIQGKMPVGLQGSFNLCDVRDLAAGCIAAADKGRIGECYILGNDEVTLKQMCEMLHEETGCPKIKFYLPLWLAGRVAASQEKKARKTGKKPLMTTFNVYNLKRNNTFDSSKAKRELGYSTRPYQETIHDEVVWMKEANLIPAFS